MRITKKQFIDYLKCRRLSWLNIKSNFMKNQHNTLDYLKPEEENETLLDGAQIGELARKYFEYNNRAINIDFFKKWR